MKSLADLLVFPFGVIAKHTVGFNCLDCFVKLCKRYSICVIKNFLDPSA